jgi:ATP-dependent protease ClpP protease subunit
VEKARRGLKLKIRNRNNDEFHTATGRSPEKIAQDQECERVFTAAEARQYGLIDRVDA